MRVSSSRCALLWNLEMGIYDALCGGSARGIVLRARDAGRGTGNGAFLRTRQPWSSNSWGKKDHSDSDAKKWAALESQGRWRSCLFFGGSHAFRPPGCALVGCVEWVVGVRWADDTRWTADALDAGVKVNPCNSKLHPAVKELGCEPSGPELSVQEAYVPSSKCFGCGPASEDGLHLRSYRIPGGLEARATLPGKFQAFPGIVNGGVLGILFECHGNWTASVALMDRAFLPRPALTMTHQLHVTYHDPTPPDTELLIRSKVLSIKEWSPAPGAPKTSVDVEIKCFVQEGTGGQRLSASAVGTFKKMGALRAL